MDQTTTFFIMCAIKIPLALLLVVFCSVLANDPKGPKNTAAIAGSAIQMTCGEGSETTPFWFHRSPLDTTEQVVYDKTNIKLDAFSNTNATGRVPGQILNISPVHLKNSGVFKCALSPTQFSAQLTVLESVPVCGTTFNASHQGFVHLWCRVNFTGFWPPRMQWMQGNRSLKSEQQRSNTSLSSTVKVKAEPFGGKTNYTCKTFFVAEDNTLKHEQQIVKNVPNLTFEVTSDAVFNSATQNGPLIIELTTHHQSAITNGIIWILTACAALACLAVFGVIVYYVRKHPDVCKKSAGPDLVQNAEVIQIGGYPLGENRVDVHPHGCGQDFEAEEPEEMHENNLDYAEVVVMDRKFPPYMQDSPAWNNVHGGACNYSVQNSPAWSHSSKNMNQSRCATPRNGSPMVNIEDTQYLDINTVATIPVPQTHPPRRPPARLPTFQAVSYASIDHTSRPPPPLPPGED